MPLSARRNIGGRLDKDDRGARAKRKGHHYRRGQSPAFPHSLSGNRPREYSRKEACAHNTSSGGNSSHVRERTQNFTQVFFLMMPAGTHASSNSRPRMHCMIETSKAGIYTWLINYEFYSFRSLLYAPRFFPREALQALKEIATFSIKQR